MKRIAVITGLTTWISCLAMVALAQGPHGMAQRRWYDPKTEITFQGVVEKVNRVSRPNGRGTGIHLTVKGEAETYNVRVGPAAFVDKTMTFKEGDKIEVIGSKVTMMGKTAVIAREIKRGDQTLTLRDQDGVPKWRGTRTPIS